MKIVWLWASLILMSVVIVGFFLSRERRKITRGREPKSVAAIYESISENVSFDVFRDLLQEMGNAYSLNPELIRPDDDLKSFARYDSWRLGDGTERLERWMLENGVDASHIAAETVLDLARIVEAARLNNSDDTQEG